MKISISGNTKKVTIDFYTSINFDFLDCSEHTMFIWKNNSIVASVTLDPDNDYSISYIFNNKRQFFSSLLDLNDFLNE